MIINLNNLSLLPEIFLSISIIYLLIFGSIISTHKTFPLIQNLILNLSILTLIFSLFLVLNDKLWVKEILSFNNTVINDYLSFISKITILIFSIICMICIQNYIKDQKINQFEYIIVILFSILGLMILCSANDLLTSYLAIELQSLSFYVMSAFKKNSSFSVDAGLKYFILGSFSSAILLLGFSFLYGITGSLNFEDYRDMNFQSSFHPNYYLNDLNSNFQFSNLIVSYGDYIILSSITNTLNFMEFKDIYDTFFIEDLKKNFDIYSNLGSNNLNNNPQNSCGCGNFNYFFIKLSFDKFIDIFDTDTAYKTSILYENHDVIYILKNYLDDILISNIDPYEKLHVSKINLKFDFNDVVLLLVTLEVLDYLFSSSELNSFFLLNCLNYLEKNGKFISSSNLDFVLKPSELFLKEKLQLKSEYIIKIHSDKLDMETNSIICESLTKNYLSLISDSINEHYFNQLININDFILFGLMLIFVSLMFKLSLAPIHSWSPDIYENSPTSSTLFFAVVSKISILVLLIRIFYNSFQSLIYIWNYYIIVIALFSVLAGSFTALEQRQLKSLLAYSSISHSGYILISFCSGTFEGIQSLIFYLIIYMLSSSCVWTIFILLKPITISNKKANKDLGDLASLIKSNINLGFIFSTVLFSIAGFPPLIGFFTKINIFLTAIESSLYFAATLSILSSVISTFYYIRIIKIICFENKVTGKLFHPLPYLGTLIIVIHFFLIIFLFINPTVLYLISHKISLLHFY